MEEYNLRECIKVYETRISEQEKTIYGSISDQSGKQENAMDQVLKLREHLSKLYEKLHVLEERSKDKSIMHVVCQNNYCYRAFATRKEADEEIIKYRNDNAQGFHRKAIPLPNMTQRNKMVSSFLALGGFHCH